MVRSDVHIGSRSTQTVFIVESNRNLSWQQSKWLFLFLAACICIVSFYFASLGAWLVLPFTGLEILIVGGAIYAQSCCAHRKQIIRVDQSLVEVDESRRRHALKSFPKAWSKVVQIHDRRGWYPSRLLIGSHGEFVEIGKNLIDDERELLANQLRCAIEGA
ncbi:MAG: DUF2244 domain-containing protein [Candidatus Thiodiazotropha sp. (ex Semelilucina semeliformis)]|nr:DUF2244 domain-containing protein [Candidatus Thiodiazotropha sp. (ex Semelilucina semeliformis)]